MAMPKQVKIVEVGPRDGLQNEPGDINPTLRIDLVNRLTEAGLPAIEVGSFVSPKWVPQMANTDQVIAGITQREGVSYSVLTPNLKGFDAAMEANCKEVAVFAAASEGFSQKNINCSIKESLERFEPVMAAAELNKIPVRGYVSCVATCPYEGAVLPEAVATVANTLTEMGCYEVSLGDTTGAGTPAVMLEMLEAVCRLVPVERLAAHCHDTYGQALANIFAMLQSGVSVVDSSVAGLGGCPYAKGATGNVATEDVLYMLNDLNIETGVNFDALLETGRYISTVLKRENQSRVSRALAAKH